MKKLVEKYSLEFVLAVIVATFLIISLLFKKVTEFLPVHTITILIVLLVLIKLSHISKRGGTVFEDYASLSILVVLAILRFLTVNHSINTPIIAVGIVATLHSVGIIPSLNKISKSRNVTSFIASYLVVIVAVIFLFAGTYTLNSGEFEVNGSGTALQFTEAFYFSTITFTTVGYGDITPTGINRLIASIEALTGIILNIGFIGYILASRRFRNH